MANKVELSNGKSFKTQKEAKEHFKKMLASYNDGDRITKPDDISDLMALVERYDKTIQDPQTKIGSGIDHFVKRKNHDAFNTSSFWIIRTDRSETDFSYIKAVKGKGRSREEEFYRACSTAIQDDLQSLMKKYFKKNDGNVKCELSDELISLSNSTLHHAKPKFTDIVKEFRKLKGWEDQYPFNILTIPKDSQAVTKFVNNNLVEEFRKFYREIAVLYISEKGKKSDISYPERPIKFENDIDI